MVKSTSPPRAPGGISREASPVFSSVPPPAPMVASVVSSAGGAVVSSSPQPMVSARIEIRAPRSQMAGYLLFITSLLILVHVSSEYANRIEPPCLREDHSRHHPDRQTTTAQTDPHFDSEWPV